MGRNLSSILLVLLVTSCTGQEPTFKGNFAVPGFAIKFSDCIEAADGGFIFSGRLDQGDHQTHSDLYGYDHKKYPAFIQEGFYFSPVTIVHKVTAKGDSLWTRLYPQSLDGTSIAATPDGGFVIAGFRPTDREEAYKGDHTQAATVLKIDKDGKGIWFKLIPSNYNSTARDIKVMQDGSILVLADHGYPSTSDFELAPTSCRLLKLDTEGNLIWDKEVLNQGNTSGNYVPEALLIDKQEMIYILGTRLIGNSPFIMVAQLDAEGTLKKHTNIKEPMDGKTWIWGQAIAETSDGFIISGGEAFRKDHILKLDRNLSKVWEVVLEGDAVHGTDILVNDQDDIYFSGVTRNDSLMLAKLSSDKEILWQKQFGNTSLFKLGHTEITSSGNLIITGSKHTSGISNWQGLFFKVDAEGNFE